MLKELQVKNFAIIDDAALNFDHGLNILTGETGAGKTLVIEAINLLIGERADHALIRDGEDRLLVQGYFDFSKNRLAQQFLDQAGLGQKDAGYSDMVLSREVNRKGKNRAYINGIFVQVSTLKELGKRCIDIHGQHQHQYLLDTKNHIKIIDYFGKEQIRDAKNAYQKALNQYLEAKKKLDTLLAQQSQKEEKLQDLMFQVEEIEGLNIKDGEEQALENERNILRNYEKIFGLCSESIQTLKGEQGQLDSLTDQIGEVKNNVAQLAQIDPSFKRYTEDIASISAVLEDLSHYLNSYIADFEYSPQKLDQIQERLYKLDGLKKKYKMDLASLKKYGQTLRQEIDNFSNIDQDIAYGKKTLSQKQEAVKNEAIALSGQRKKIGAQIEAAVTRELKDLHFKNVVFNINQDHISDPEGISVGDRKVKLTGEGIDRIEFMISLNVGQAPRPLKKIASGGEVSRIMLALKSIIGSIDFISTMIFDEIDAGIGGATSLIVGQKLFKISRGYQVICITHLAQIAAFADSHYFIEKYTQAQKTKIRLGALDGQQKIKELSRMLSGLEDSSISVKHAQELMEKCHHTKKEIGGKG